MNVYTPIAGIQRAMNLVMPLADPSYAGIRALATEVFGLPDGLTGPLDTGGTIHFARFVVIGDNLVMASSYDGEFSDYIQMFIDRIGDVFNQIMTFVVEPAPTPVQDHPDAFVDWVHRHDHLSIGFYSGYPGFTTQPVRAALQLKNGGGTRSNEPEQPVPELNQEALEDVQGLILRGFGHPVTRHVVLEVADPARARSVLAQMARPSDPTQPTPTAAAAAAAAATAAIDVPRITSSADWGESQPPVCWTLGITASGLVALGVPNDSIRSFPTEFLAGAKARAFRVGDVGRNAPNAWAEGFNDPGRIHVLLSLYARDTSTRDTAFASLNSLINGGFNIVETFDAGLFEDSSGKDYSQVVHFGYRDNISQPFIAGDPVPLVPDHQPRAAAGEFILGYRGTYGVMFDVPQPMELGTNGSFSAFRILEQDVVGFETFLETKGAESGLGKELLAAKVVGRWRNGLPLALSPDTDSPTPPLADDQLNNYGYTDDGTGLRCPVGAHMRRANPRDQPMKPIGDSQGRRIMRRAMPYGPQWKPGDPPDNQERGLVGHFIGASLLLQFETIMGEWINTGLTEPGISGTNDAMLGPDRDHMRLDVPKADGSTTSVTGFGPFVRTRAGIYAFLPSLTALRWIGSL